MEKYNRVEGEMLAWRNLEKRQQGLDPRDLSTNVGFLRKKLEFFDLLSTKYQGTLTTDEVISLSIIKREQREVERLVNPNKIIRWLRSALIQSKKRSSGQQIQNYQQENQRAVANNLDNIGFNEVSQEVIHHMKSGKESFVLTTFRDYGENEKVQHDLQFIKAERDRYEMSIHKAILYSGKETRESVFLPSERLNADQCYHLLSGRALVNDSGWIQLDFNDKNALGAHRIKRLGREDNFDMATALKTANFDGNLSGIVKTMKRGEQAILENKNGQTYIVEANPLGKSIKAFDSAGSGVEVTELNANQTLSLKPENSKGNKESQTLGDKPPRNKVRHGK